MMQAPTTVKEESASLQVAVSGGGLILTVKLMDVMRDRLHGGTAARCPHEQTLLLGLALVYFKDHSKGDECKKLDDAECADGPSPGRVREEGLGCEGAGEGSDDLAG